MGATTLCITTLSKMTDNAEENSCYSFVAVTKCSAVTSVVMPSGVVAIVAAAKVAFQDWSFWMFLGLNFDQYFDEFC